MNLEQLSYVGDLVAALGVIVSLVYLARQVHGNTEAMRANSESLWSTINVNLSAGVALDRAAAEWWAAGNDNFERLDEIDQQRHVLWEYAVFQFWWALYKARQRGQVDDDQWGVTMRTVSMFGQRQAIRAAWRRFGQLFPADFRCLLEPHLDGPPKGQDPDPSTSPS